MEEMEKENLQDWLKEVANTPGFSGSFESDPARTLIGRGFGLHDSLKRVMGNLKKKQKEVIARAFGQVVEADTPEKRRQIYSEWAEQYELLYGWEGSLEEGPRGWSSGG